LTSKLMPDGRTLLVCSCEDTMPLDARAFERGRCGGDVVAPLRPGRPGMRKRLAEPDVTLAIPGFAPGGRALRRARPHAPSFTVGRPEAPRSRAAHGSRMTLRWRKADSNYRSLTGIGTAPSR
jgi:hypothetical protein